MFYVSNHQSKNQQQANPMTTPEAPKPSFAVKGQYIKDLSFENPHAPHSLTVADQKPAIDINVDLRGEKLQDNFYEMTLHLTARATVENGTMFLVDMQYAGIFELQNIPEDRIEPLLWVDCPFVLFPFARRVIADITRDGGFPPLLLDPIDFHALYLHNKAKAMQQSA